MEVRDLIESFDGPFFTEASIDADNLTIKGVCPFGTDKSANNRIYKERAIESLTSLVNGSKMYLNHPTKSELKERDGVRDVRDWAGVFRNPRKESKKVFADLQVREQYWDLLRDVATLQPEGMGLSINARVKVFADEKGMESVEDVDTLRSVDLVANAATTRSLFESVMDKVCESNARLIVVPGSVEKLVELLFVQEGVIQDKLDNDKVKREIEDVTYTANGMIERVLYDEKLSIDEKKKKIMAIFADLDGEVKKRLSGIKEQLTKNTEEDMMEITLDMLKKDHSGLVEDIINEYKEKENVEKMKQDLLDAQEALTKKDEKIASIKEEKGKLEERVTTLEQEISDLKEKLDKVELQEKVAEKRSKIQGLISEAKLPKEAVSNVWFASLMKVEEYKKDDETVTMEDQVKELIEDRRNAYEGKDTGKVSGSGDEFKEKENEGKEVTEQTVKGFIEAKKAQKERY